MQTILLSDAWKSSCWFLKIATYWPNRVNILQSYGKKLQFFPLYRNFISILSLHCVLPGRGICGIEVGKHFKRCFIMRFFFWQEAAILDHYTTVADKSPVPVVIYNMPIVTGIDIPISVLTKLSSHPNILGVKDGDVSIGLSVFYISPVIICIRKMSFVD